MTDRTPAHADHLLAEFAVRRHLECYADGISRRAWDDVGALFLDDAHLDLDLGGGPDEVRTFVGPEAITTFIAAACERFSFFQFVILNSVAEVDLDAGRAASRTWIAELRQDIAQGRRTTAVGCYHDLLVSDPDGGPGWRFERRRYTSVSRTAGPDADVDQLVFTPRMAALTELLADSERTDR